MEIVDALGQLRRIPMRVAGVAAAALAAALLVPIGIERLGSVGGGVEALYKNGLVNAVILAAAVSCGLRAALVREERVAWALLAAGIGSYGIGQIYWAFWLEQLDDPPYPSVSDGFWLAFYPLAYVALLLIVRRRVSWFSASVWLDGIVGGAALASVGEAFAFGPILRGSHGLDGIAEATTLAYPVADLGLTAIVVGAFALTGWRPDGCWLLLGGGCALLASADTVYTSMIAGGNLVTTVAIDGAWAFAFLAIGSAAWLPMRRRSERVEGWPVLAVPAAATGLALGILVYGGHRPLNGLATTLAAVAIAAGGVRTLFTFRELRALERSRKESLTDYLTGLANRRALMSDLGETLRRGRPTTLVLFDLDGFKTYNDRFGHSEGDLLLARLGRRLRLAVEERGRAYRLGGDEFCVLVSATESNSEVVVRAAAALAESGEEFVIGCSSGTAAVPGEATDPSSALRLADERMYAEKAVRPEAAKQQAGAVALRILAEQRPALGRHVRGVEILAVLVGRRFGISGSDLDDLARVADLHDIGKIAIPAEILDKPGPLDGEEWEFIRRHTLVGERMLASAPALARVGRIVRSTHERFDGAGYPDGLAGSEIPIAARIVAVCDAFDAMTSERPYRPKLSFESGLAELRRCAGTQFDPDVVDAFLAEQAARKAAA